MTAPVLVPATELTFIEGSSAKFYRTYACGQVAHVQYGRLGTFGSWQTKEFPNEDAAAAHARKQAESKWKKGYQYVKDVILSFDTTPAQADLANALDAAQAEPCQGADRPVIDATVTVAAADAVMPDAVKVLNPQPYDGDNSTPRAMLAQTVDAAGVTVDSMVAAWGYVTQRKYDGDRVLIDVIDGVVSVYGRNGQAKQRDVNPTLLAPFANLTVDRWTFDGEMLGGRQLVLFDLIEAPSVEPASIFPVRYETLTHIVGALGVNPDEIVVAPVADTPAAKQAMLDQAQAEGWEGVIFRDRSSDSGYVAGRTSKLVKHKFVREADCVVIGLDDVKQSASLGLYHHETGEAVYIGKVSTIGKGIIDAGDVIEVRYLYVTDPDSPRLYQPRIMRKRTDKTAGECTTEQLLGASTNKAV